MPIHIAVQTELDNRRARADVEKLRADYTRAGRDAGDGFGREYAKGVERSSPRVTKAYTTYARALDKVADSQAKARQELQRHSEVLKANANDTERVVRSAERLAKANRDSAAAMRSARSSHVDYTRSLRNLGDSAGGVEGALRRLGTTIGALGRVATPVVGLGLAGVLYDAAGAAGQASKALWVLPAAATAAGAAIGTLSLATSGFSDTVGDLASGDVKKFAEDIQKLAPNAQQAALSIQKIYPALRGLQQATQDAFFAGLGAQIERLSTEYLPSIQNLTTSIADSFNQMLHGIADELMTPDTQAQLQNVFDNLGATFRNLVPAARDFARAFVDIVSAGSNVLPDLASGAADLAREFAAFIRDARQSGQLETWIRDGIDAVHELSTAIFEVGGEIFDVFGADGRKNVQDFKQDLENLRDTIKFLQGDWGVLGKSFVDDFLNVARGSLGDFIVDVPEMFHAMVNGVVDALNWLGDRIADFANVARNSLGILGQAIPEISIPDIPHWGGTSGDWGAYTVPPDANVNTEMAPPLRPGHYRDRYGHQRPMPDWQPSAPGQSWAGPYGVPAPSDAGAGTPTTGYAAPGPMGTQPYMGEIASLASRFGLTVTSGKRNEPGSYHNVGEALDIGGDQASMMAFANYMAAEFGNQLQELIYGQPGFTGLIGDRQNVTGTGYYSAKTLSDHLDHVHVAMDGMLDTTKEYGTQLDHMADATRRASDATATYTASQQELGAQLDKDFGISKGLPGIAENITKFLANLAFAPALGALSAVTDTFGTAGKGSGLLGMLAPRENAAGTPMPNALGQFSDEQIAQMWQELYGANNGAQPGTPGPGNAPADPRSIAQQQMAAYGWGPSEWPALNQLWQAESGWDPTATNPKSGAFGIAQFLGHENDKYGAMGGYNPDATSQVNAGLSYIADRYGSPSAAWAHWVANNSYDDGGTVPGYGNDPLWAILHPGETVLPTKPGQNPLDVFAPTKPAPGVPYNPQAPMLPGQPGSIPLGGPQLAGGPFPRPLPPREVAELPTKPAGRYPGQGLNLPKGEGIKPGGGIIGLAESAAVSAAGMAGGVASFGAGGAAAAAGAQIAIDEINRAIQFGGQVAGIAVQGLMETFLPNESPLADIGGGWLGRVAGAVAGVSAGTPNLAGAIGQMLQGKPEDQAQPPGDQAPPGTPASGIGLGPPPGPTVDNRSITVNAANANPNEIANTLDYHQRAMYSGPGR